MVANRRIELTAGEIDASGTGLGVEIFVAGFKHDSAEHNATQVYIEVWDGKLLIHVWDGSGEDPKTIAIDPLPMPLEAESEVEQERRLRG